MKRVLVFGTFDGIHEGHREMLKQAKALGNYLVVAVAPDNIVKEVKGTLPKYSSAQRISNMKKERLTDEVVLGDSDLDVWDIIATVKPQIIALGYDQDELSASLDAHLEEMYPDIETSEGFQTNPKKPTIVRLNAHEPEKYHNRLISNS